MPRNFDELHTDDRTFTIGGETFEWRYLHWKEFAGAIDEEVAEVAATNGQPDPELVALGGVPEQEEKDESGTIVASYERVIARILLYLKPEDKDRFADLAVREENPVSVVQLNELADWLLEVQTARPTQPPTPSTGGRGRAARTSAAS